MLCAVCSKPSSYNCAKCGFARYCSKDCQKQAWPEHKKTCKRKPQPQPPSPMFTMPRSRENVEQPGSPYGAPAQLLHGMFAGRDCQLVNYMQDFAYYVVETADGKQSGEFAENIIFKNDYLTMMFSGPAELMELYRQEDKVQDMRQLQVGAL